MTLVWGSEAAPNIPDDEARIREVTVMKMNPRGGIVRIYVDVIDSVSVKCACTADDAVDLIPPLDQELCVISALADIQIRFALSEGRII